MFGLGFPARHQQWALHRCSALLVGQCVYLVALPNLGHACPQNPCCVPILSALAPAVDATRTGPWLQLANAITLIPLRLSVLLYCLLLKLYSQGPNSDLEVYGIPKCLTKLKKAVASNTGMQLLIPAEN